MTEMEVRPAELSIQEEMTIEQLTGQVRKVQEAMKAVMKEGTHYGVIPGTDKPTLLKPGAEKLCLLFRLDPDYQTTEHFEGMHYTVKSKCVLHHIPTGNRVGSGEGLATSRERKYAERAAKPTCPTCGNTTIIKGKEEYGGGWICWKKQGGCGAKFPDGTVEIEIQKGGTSENRYLPDTWNTVLKMANKRALIAAVLNATAASDIFTQDIEDLPDFKPDTKADTVEAEIVDETASDDLRAELGEQLEVMAMRWPDTWGQEQVFKTATRRFGRMITNLDGLTANEAEQILEGARAYAAEHE